MMDFAPGAKKSVQLKGLLFRKAEGSMKAAAGSVHVWARKAPFSKADYLVRVEYRERRTPASKPFKQFYAKGFLPEVEGKISGLLDSQGRKEAMEMLGAVSEAIGDRKK